MATFNLTIKLGNDAMQTPHDIAGALFSVVELMRYDTDDAERVGAKLEVQIPARWQIVEVV